MFSHQFLLQAAVLLPFFVNSAAAIARMVPHSDPFCKKPIKFNGLVKPLHKPLPARQVDALVFPYGISKPFPNAFWYNKTDFPDADGPEGSSAYNVWWQIEGADRGCRYALLKEYQAVEYGSVGTGPYSIVPPGDVILNVDDSKSCVYSSIPLGRNLATSFCCGALDCSVLAVGNMGIITRDQKHKARRGMSPAARASELIERSDVLQPRSWSATGPFVKRSEGFDNCKAADVSTPFPNAGRQTAVSNPQECPGDSDSCGFQIQHGISLGTTLMSSKEQTITNEVGATFGVTAGSQLLGASATAETSYSFAKSIATSIGMEVSSQTTYAVTQDIKQPKGTTAFVTFTPTYHCRNAKLDCGGKTESGEPVLSEEFTMCEPQFLTNGDSKVPQGKYTLVFTE